MAFHCTDKQGNAIMTDILVSGYIRYHIEPIINQHIPFELYTLCFEYWLHQACDGGINISLMWQK